MVRAAVNAPRRDAPSGRDETECMIQEMGWIPSDFPSSGATALMRSRFSEAVAAFSLSSSTERNPDAQHSACPPRRCGTGPGTELG